MGDSGGVRYIKPRVRCPEVVLDGDFMELGTAGVSGTVAVATMRECAGGPGFGRASFPRRALKSASTKVGICGLACWTAVREHLRVDSVLNSVAGRVGAVTGEAPCCGSDASH